MSSHRFFLQDPLPSEDGAVELPLSVADRHHACDVLRVRPGEEVVVVAPEGAAYRVRLHAITTESVSGAVVARVEVPRVPRVWLVQGLAKGEKMDLVVRMATELGVERIVPLVTSRAVVRLDAERAEGRVARWRRIAQSAAEQAQLVRVPVIAPPADVSKLLSVLAGAGLVLVAWEEADGAPGIPAAVASAGVVSGPVAVVVGPEGGFAREEVELLVDGGARVVSLGQTVLRTETAGAVASALALAALGGLGGQ
ncbi:MAG: 16S rRNA (uracil(1498)-N(3))-methyltransferase [Actinomycetia bacterium]|nr:16S rRNA (uracil(1498)-N(3))-methyltransferase [Actinomycetes bacterium]